jgi:hypothetical protein
MGWIIGVIIVGYLLHELFNVIFSKKKTEKNPYGKGGIVLTEEQKERYTKELASDNWKHY